MAPGHGSRSCEGAEACTCSTQQGRQVDGLSRHHIRQRVGWTGRAPVAPWRARRAGEIREGLTQEVAWEVGLRKRKDWCTKSMAVTAGRTRGQGQEGDEASLITGRLGISWESWDCSVCELQLVCIEKSSLKPSFKKELSRDGKPFWSQGEVFRRGDPQPPG